MKLGWVCLLISIVTAYHTASTAAVRVLTGNQLRRPQKRLSFTVKNLHDTTLARSSHAAEQTAVPDLHTFDGIILWCWAVSSDWQDTAVKALFVKGMS